MASEPVSASNTTEDVELMRRVQESDENAFAELMHRWERPVKAVIARLVLNARDAEELAQETFVRIWQQRARFEPGRAVKPWIMGIAVNLARNRLRWWRRRPSISLEAWTEAPAENDPTAGPVVLERDERAAAVRDAVAGLPVDLREALVLFEYEQMSYDEIGLAVGATRKAVENRIARARAKLRPALAQWA